MPIYAYKCSACGFAKDVLQKMSDAPLTECPACGAAAFSKQLTAAGFQLKGSGWYVTDFRDGGGKKGTDKRQGRRRRRRAGRRGCRQARRGRRVRRHRPLRLPHPPAPARGARRAKSD